MIACFKESKHQQFTQKAERRKKVPSMNRRRDRIQYFPPGLQKATEFQFNEFLFWVKHLERTSLSFMRDANKVARSFDNGHSANILRQIADLPAWVDQARNAQSLQCWKHNSYKRWGFMSCFFPKTPGWHAAHAAVETCPWSCTPSFWLRTLWPVWRQSLSVSW